MGLCMHLHGQEQPIVTAGCLRVALHIEDIILLSCW